MRVATSAGKGTTCFTTTNQPETEPYVSRELLHQQPSFNAFVSSATSIHPRRHAIAASLDNKSLSVSRPFQRGR